MSKAKLLATLIAAMMLSACVGIVVPIPVKSSGAGSQTTNQNQQR